VDSTFEPLIRCAIERLSTPDPDAVFDGDPEQVASLVAAVKRLYKNMDSSLRFAAPERSEQTKERSDPAEVDVDIFEDYRGVACPLNYVKTKLALERMDEGQTLAILLDEEGAKNVPASAASDGHEVLSVEREDNHWRVVVRKGKEGG
jgi:sulfite reductase (ferredoxin)